MIKSFNLKKTINNNVILNNRSDIFHAGSINCLWGDSGSGKSTYLSLIARINSLTEGIILFNDENINTFNFDYYMLKICGYINQNPYLPSEFTLKDLYESQILLLKKYTNKKYNYINFCENLGIEKYLNQYPQNLSGGQRYRASLILSLIGEKKIILIDEPTAHLDEIMSFKVINLLKEYTKTNQSVCIISTHDNYIKDKSDFLIKI
jgi:ABC-type lipoprotein export system ATPase subunit